MFELICFTLMLVCEALDMPPRCVSVSRLSDDIGHVCETLSNVTAVLQLEVDTSRRTLLEKHQIVEEFKKLKTPIFNGGPTPTDPKQWLMQIEKIFVVINYEQQHKVRLVTFMFQGKAKRWWKPAKRILLQTEEPISWKGSLEKLSDKYFLSFVRQ